MAHVCILYAVENQPFASKLEDVLFEMGHAVSRREVDQDACAILGAAGGEPDAMLVIWSAASVSCPAVIAHARRALAHRTLTPVAIGKIEPPQSFQHLWPIDLSGWSGDQEDPRWRFVTDEINLSIRRSEIGFEDLSMDAPIEKTQKKSSFKGPAVLFGGAVALAAATLSLVAVAPLIFGGETPKKPSVAFVNPETVTPIDLEDNADKSAETKIKSAAIAPSSEEKSSEALAPTLANLQDVADVQEISNIGKSAETQQNTLPADKKTNAAKEVPTADINAEETADPIENNSASSNPVQEVIVASLETENTTSVGDNPFDPIAGGDDLGFGVDLPFDAPEPSLKPVAIAQADSPTEIAAASVAATTASSSTIPEAIDTDGLDRLIIESTALKADTDHDSGSYFRDCVECPDMAELPGGSFIMGTPLEERARDEAELTLQERVIPYRFAIGAREVTFEQWDACVADGGCQGHKAADYGWGRKTRPVINVSWEDAQSFVEWLSRKTGQNYRLPTEAEWEYAARAGAQTPFSFGASVSDRLANFNAQYKYGAPAGVYRKQTTPVASFTPNAFGLFDMHGNVWEWTADCWSAEESSGAQACEKRVLKGGAWNTGGWRLRAGHRIPENQTSRDFDNGFRVARTLE